jgi:hypothetical protein
MRTRNVVWVGAAVGFSIATLGWTQSAAPPPVEPPRVIAGMSGFATATPPGSGAALIRNAVRGQPYGLVETTTRSNTRPDGTTTTNVVVTDRMRDSEGRVREAVGGAGVSYTLTDPVALLTAVVFPKSKLAIVTRYAQPKPLTPEQEARQAELNARTQAFRKAHPSPDVELPGKLIDGVYALGVRHVVVVPAFASPTGQEVRIVEEKWASPELKITVASTTDNPMPKMGKIAMVISHLQRADPDPALFEIPGDYKIEENQP